jgi:hypothetical protein
MREERSVARESVSLTKADTDVMTVTDKETPEQIQRVHLAGVHFGFGCLVLAASSQGFQQGGSSGS